MRELQRNMNEVGNEVEQLKASLEKGKKESKQQNGLLVTARKQLSAHEAERTKAAQELAKAQAEAETATKEREAAEAELAVEPEPEPVQINEPALSAFSPSRTDTTFFAAGQPLPVTPLASSPTGSLRSKNPFGW